MADVAELSPAWEAVAAGLRPFAHPPDWLLAQSDPERVAAALVEHVPELATREVVLTELEVRNVRTKRSSRRALYRMAVVEAGAAERILELRGELYPPGRPGPRAGSNRSALGSEGWRCYLPELRLELTVEPPDDEALPALRLLTDPVAARGLIEDAIRRGSPRYSGLRIEACRPRVMRYKPGSRCTVLYELRYPTEGDGCGPKLVVAKTYRDGDKGRTAYEGMRSLWASPLRTSGLVTLAEPLAFLPETNVLLQSGLPYELTLKQLLRGAMTTAGDEALAELSAYVSKAAVGLAALHTSGVRAAGAFTLGDELAETHAVVARLASLEPALRDAAAPLLARIGLLAAQCPAEPLVAAHGSFRPAQVLVDGGEIAFIDFDGFCAAEPALDLSLFCATLKDVGLRAVRERGDGEAPDPLRHIPKLEELCELILTRYEAAAAPVLRRRVALWETLHLLTAVLHCWTKARFDQLEHRLALLRYHLEASERVGATR
jgi:hypothetical protein